MQMLKGNKEDTAFGSSSPQLARTEMETWFSS